MAEGLQPYTVTLPQDAAVGDCTFKSVRFTRGVSQVLYLRDHEARSAAEGPFTVERVKAEKSTAKKTTKEKEE